MPDRQVRLFGVTPAVAQRSLELHGTGCNECSEDAEIILLVSDNDPTNIQGSAGCAKHRAALDATLKALQALDGVEEVARESR